MLRLFTISIVTLLHGLQSITGPSQLDKEFVNNRNCRRTFKRKIAMATTVESRQNPFNLTAAGELGSHRNTMLDNELLLRTELGKTKRRGYGVPGEGFIFGRPNEARHGGADDALHGWQNSRTVNTTTLPFPRKEKPTDRDFMALNKASVQAGLVSAQEYYEFRATHDVRRKTAGSENIRARTRRIPPTMVFGISTRPSTPIFDLLEHKYQDKWLSERRKQELAKRKEETKQKRNPNKVYDTRASLLRTYQNPVEPAPLWQMSKFRNVRPSLETFRTPVAREAAYDNFTSDEISRKGKLGHGIYESAKN